MYEITFHAMGCEMKALLDSYHERAKEILTQVPVWFEEWEAILSRFRPESELCQLNGRPGEWVRVSRVLYTVLEDSLQAAVLTGGLVDPTVLSALEAAGYDRAFDEIGGFSGPPVRASDGVPAGSWLAVELERSRTAVRLPVGTRVDLAGVAKGWAADSAVDQLAAFGPALVDAGGDIALRGPRSDGTMWGVGVARPGNGVQDIIGFLELEGGFVATSGRDFRRWRSTGGWMHHIIDPRSGLPADTDAMSATVVGPYSMLAEAGAKAAMILGSRDGLQWLEDQKDLEGLLVLEDGQRIVTSGLEEVVTWSDE